jgi:hypothetical protein
MMLRFEYTSYFNHTVLQQKLRQAQQEIATLRTLIKEKDQLISILSTHSCCASTNSTDTDDNTSKGNGLSGMKRRRKN